MQTAGSSAPGPTARALSAGFVVLLAALAGFSLLAQSRDAERVPARHEAAPIAARIASEFAAGDAVRVLPLWWDDGRRGLDGLPLLVQEPLDDWDRHRFERMWLAYPATYAELAERDRSWLVDVETIVGDGPMRLERGRVAQSRDVRWDAFTALQDAFVTRLDNDSERARECNHWDGRAWHCGAADEFIFVGRAVREMDDQYRECVAANPPPNQERWAIEFEDVPTAGRLDVRAGIALASARLPRGSETVFRVFVDEQQVVEHSFGKEELGYPEWSVPLEGDGAVNVRFEISAVDHLDRFFCFRAQAVAPRE